MHYFSGKGCSESLESMHYCIGILKDALKQIEDRRYEDQLLEEGVEHILKYGIAFYKKKYTKAAEPLRDSDSMVLLFTVCIDEVA